LYLIIGTLGNHNRFLFIANGFPHNRKFMFVIPTLFIAPDFVGIDRHLLNLIVSPDRYEFIIEDKESLFGEINLNVFSLLSFVLCFLLVLKVLLILSTLRFYKFSSLIRATQF